MATFKPKACRVCGELYTPTGHCSYYCKVCAPIQAKLRAKENGRNFRIRRGCLVGVGKGGAPHSGDKNPMWKGGVCSPFRRYRTQMRKEILYCEWCHKDLTAASRYEWCVHHLDHNRKNNVRENLVMLCKRCHQTHHDCVSHLEGATTTSLKRGQRLPSRPDEDIVSSSQQCEAA